MNQSICEIIKEELKVQERSITWFANKLSVDRTSVYRLFRKNSIDTELLMRISVILNRNFFEELGSEFINKQNSPQ